jgi:uridine kinase
MTRQRVRGRTAKPLPKGPVLIAIVGGSGSGKTWVTERLAAVLKPDVAEISLDGFYLDRSHLSAERRAGVNFDHPRAIDWAEFGRVLRRLASRQSANAPRYDFSTHCRLPKARRVSPKPIVLVEGLWLLNRPALRRLFAFSVFLECPARVRLQRRLARDLATRGRTASSVRRQFWNTVQPMHRLHVAPQARFADIKLSACGRREVLRLAEFISQLAAPPGSWR